MGYDRRLCADVLAVFIAALRRSLRHRAKRELGLRSVDDAQIGALTFVQRGDSSLRLNVHFHSLALDGVYVRDDANVLQSHALSTPTPEQVAEVARWTYEGLARVCERHGRSFDELDTDADTDDRRSWWGQRTRRSGDRRSRSSSTRATMPVRRATGSNTPGEMARTPCCWTLLISSRGSSP